MVERSAQTAATAWLVPISGPRGEALQLVAKADGVVIGRHERCDLCLPADADQVSRHHARFSHHDGSWHVADLESAWGTFVNGMRLAGGREVPLREGDLLRITPWTFAFAAKAVGRGVQTLNDDGTTIVRTVSSGTLVQADQTVGLLLESAAAIHGAEDERQLAELVIDAACRGTGLTHAAMLRPTDAMGRVEVIAARGPGMVPAGVAAGPGREVMTFSRSLLAAAASGNVAELQGGVSSAGDVSQSIVMMKISAALCVPLMLGGAPAAYLYLDSRGAAAQTLRVGASAYCAALGRMASLALANLKRMEMERRGAGIEADLRAASVAQAFIFPERFGRHGVLTAIGESRPGQFVGGDFFDVIPLEDGRIAVALGDVTGKGIAASVLMTAAQGFLHATLLDRGDAGAAVTALNRFICPRSEEGKFVTLWAAVFDTAARTVSYVDAGHGYALRRSGKQLRSLGAGDGLPVGVEEGAQYVSVIEPFVEGDQVLIVSDGIVEQPGLVPGTERGMERRNFGIAGVEEMLGRAGDDPVADIFGAVFHHAGTNRLADDATAVLVRW